VSASTRATAASLAEAPGIGLYGETDLHAELKALYASPLARYEVNIAGKIVDVVNPDEFVEIQTRNLAAITAKVLSLACRGAVRVVYPIHAERFIERLAGSESFGADPAGAGLAMARRRSPLKRNFYHIFEELVHAPRLVASPNVSLDVLLVRVTELRRRSGVLYRGRYRDEVLERRLDAVLERRRFDSQADWLNLLPANLDGPLTSGALGTALGIAPERARQILYVYCRAGLLAEQGRAGRQKQYAYAAHTGRGETTT